MNKKICQYSIIRFQPFVETGEFANIGIVLYLPETKELHFKLLSAKEHERITHFFKPLKKDIFTSSIQIIRAELERIQNFLTKSKIIKVDFYEDLIRPREDIIQYSKNRVLFSTDIATKTVNDLFGHYVKLNFAHKEDYEQKMQKRIQGLLSDLELKGYFKKASLGEKSKYNVNFPFVSNNHQAVIKPIHFKHPDSNKLIEHGLSWMMKIQQLKRYNFIQPNNVLFAYSPPENKQGVLFDAFRDIKAQIEDFGILTTDINDSKNITNFVRHYI